MYNVSMMKKALIAGLFVVSLAPFVSSAATVDELRAQVTELLNRISQLQGQIGTTGTTGTTGTVVTQTGGTQTVQCPFISRTLRVGATGNDVSRLQSFLAIDPAIYPEAQASGYYGPLTEAAVKRFQCKNKIVCDGTPDSTGYGVTGPRTAAILALQCPAGGAIPVGGGASVGGFIKVTPVSGAAPLTTQVQATVNTTASCSSATYTVNWGDNTGEAQIPVPANVCQPIVQNLSHTYNNPGTYTVTLRSGAHSTSATVVVTAPVTTTTPSTGQTYVGNFSLTPGTSGELSVQATFDIQTTCTAYDLDWGDGSSHASQSQGSCSGTGAQTKQFTHQYSSTGTYTITLRRGNGLTQVDSATVVVSY